MQRIKLFLTWQKKLAIAEVNGMAITQTNIVSYFEKKEKIINCELKNISHRDNFLFLIII